MSAVSSTWASVMSVSGNRINWSGSSAYGMISTKDIFSHATALSTIPYSVSYMWYVI
jgi:hypothetical protein